ncbi:MAG: phosphorylase [Nitrospirae bacterium]|nr:MAG: phosphorylase [Nitrospirota bacterium]
MNRDQHSESPSPHFFAPGSLWSLVQARVQAAHRRGILQPIPTEYEFVSDKGVLFLVRIVTSLARKEAVGQSTGRDDRVSGVSQNPFLPYDPELFVADVTSTHVCLLNKFNVIDGHILLVTREYEDQETPLSRQDFEALWRCMVEFDGLGFYNAGPVAGASQRHRHMQMVPLPLAPKGPKIPIEPVLAEAKFHGQFGGAPAFPFRHVLCRIAPLEHRTPAEQAVELHTCYQAMCQEAGVKCFGDTGQLSPYNLLITRQEMLLVPRSKECFRDISINSLGFAGAFLVKDREQLELVKQYGPMSLLREVGVPW